ncbi:MAG: hypothetical protein KTR31_11795 [Myxococcales bacterium]|nr:hypothetical protein [Myxococcales bacterium]
MTTQLLPWKFPGSFPAELEEGTVLGEPIWGDQPLEEFDIGTTALPRSHDNGLFLEGFVAVHPRHRIGISHRLSWGGRRLGWHARRGYRAHYDAVIRQVRPMSLLVGGGLGYQTISLSHSDLPSSEDGQGPEGLYVAGISPSLRVQAQIHGAAALITVNLSATTTVPQVAAYRHDGLDFSADLREPTAIGRYATLGVELGALFGAIAAKRDP